VNQAIMLVGVSLVPRLSPRTTTKNS